MRVHELAKELNVSSKDLLDKLPDVREIGKTASSSLTVDQITRLRKAFAPEAAPDAKPAVAVAVAEAPVAPAVESGQAVSPLKNVPPSPPSAAIPPKAPTAPEKRVILIKGPIIVREFAEQLAVKPNQLIAELMSMNVFASINQKIELKIAQQVATKHGCILEHEKKEPTVKPPPPTPAKDKARTQKDDSPENLKPRAPVVAFMGHVDHGKTSLLDKIRNAKVAAGEAGGITQHIGAYTVAIGKNKITFLDTPGHEAFTAMRARGANLTDIAVIVIDGVDGVMPQTREAIQHAQAAKVSIMIALNKKDLRAFNPDRVKQQLQGVGITPEDWGGDVICCPVSALTGDGVDGLLENISVQAEVLELKANPERLAQGYIVEAQLQPGRGCVATVLVRKGTLHVGDPIVCGTAWGRIKALINDRGEKVKIAGPSDAVVVLGLSEVPEAGAEVVACASDREAREIAEQRQMERKEQEMAASGPRKMSLEDFLHNAAEADKGRKNLNILIKTDVQGSLEAIQHGLGGIKSDKVTLNVVLASVGNINVNDVLLASASNAVIVGFHVSKDNEVSSMAKREGIEIRLHSIIYELIDEVRDAMLGLLDQITRENVIGHAEVRQVFDLSKKGKVAGCLVTNGKATSRSRARVKRRGDVLYVGAIVSLKRFQNDASEVRESQECGIRLDNFSNLEAGDIIEFFEVEKISQQL
ncbi:MAG TPA: translation initiation factor IF-2 [Kiritimatiellia bacterium]|jgi:translation initiation factor IF-2